MLYDCFLKEYVLYMNFNNYNISQAATSWSEDVMGHEEWVSNQVY